MKILKTLGLAAFIAAPLLAGAATTDGTASFTVTLASIPGNYSQRVDAYWVTDAAGNFIKTVRRDANSRRQYLYQWAAARGSVSWQTVDGFSGATISTWGTFTVTWDCRDTNNVIMPDGQYRFYMEMTDRNGQGPWTTNGLTFTKGSVATTNTYANQAYITAQTVVYTPASSPHDLAVLGISPAFAQPDSSIAMTVAVTNETATAETFSLTLSNSSTGQLIGSRTGVVLAGNTRTNIALSWNTAGLATGPYALTASVTLGTNDTHTADNTFTTQVTLRDPVHDVAVQAVSLPPFMAPNTTSNLVVAAQNLGDYAETFSVTVYDETDGRLVASNRVTNLPALTSTNLTMAWAAGTASLGFHSLRIEATPVTGESAGNQANNLQRASVPVANGTTSVTLIATNAVWRYSDTGLDLVGTPWRELNYYDATWKAGAAPLGYSDAAYTNYFSTIVSYGTNSGSKYITTYFRHAFPVSFQPLAATLRLKCDDGAVVYLNGQEVARLYMGSNAVAATTVATNTVGAINTVTNISFNILPQYLLPGLNEISVEVHQAAASSSDLMMGLELIATIPNLPVVNDVAVARLSPAGEALAGEVLPVSLLLTNRGNVPATFTVYLVNTNSGQVLASKVVTNLVSAGTTSVDFNWTTPTNLTGTIGLAAYTVVGSATNLAGMASATVALPGTGVGLNPVNAVSSLGGRCSAFAAEGTRLLVGAGASLLVLDIAAPASPVVLGALRLPGNVEGLVLSGTNAYAACGPAGVQIISLANPAQPVLLASMETAGHAYSVRLTGTTLVVAAGKAGLKLFNVANPAAPVLLSSYLTEGPAKALHLSGIACYVLDQHLGVSVVSLASPASPMLMGSYKFNGGMDLVVSGTRAYVVDASGRLLVVNVGSPSNPTLLYSLQLNGAFCRGVTLNNTTLYVAAETAGIITVNVASTPVVLATNAAQDSVIALLSHNATLYAADSFAGMQVLNVLNNPQAPALLATVPLGFRASDVVLAGGRAYVAAGEAGLRIFDLANPAQPALLGSFTGATNARSVALAGNLALVGEVGGVKLVNVANPAVPTLAGAYASTNLGAVRAIAATATRTVLTDGERVQLLDHGTPGAPQLLSTIASPGFALDVAVAGEIAVVAAGSAGVVLLDFSGGALNQTALYNTPGVASSVAVVSNRVQVGDGPGGWLILDIGNPAAPALVSSSTAQGAVGVVGAAGELALLGGGPGPVSVMDVSIPLTPVPQASLGPLVNALKLSGSGQLVAAAEGAAGLAILTTGAQDNDHDAMPDDWEQQIVNASKATNGPISSTAQVNPDDDFDRDGLSNRHEYIAGTSPVDAQSVFAVQAGGNAAPGSNVLRWHSVAGKTYTIYQSANLANGFTVLQADIPATPPMNAVTNAASGNAVFYLISVR